MNSPELAWTIFLSYFAIIFVLFGIVAYSIWNAWSSSAVQRTSYAKVERIKYRAGLFSALAVASLAHTWYYMITYLFASFEAFSHANSLPNTLSLHDRITHWLQGSELFEEAWHTVCDGSHEWWWSEQLCLYTIAWSVFLARQGPGHKIKHLWAYMLLGQLVAISVASNLFYVALVFAYPPGLRLPDSRLPLSVTGPIALALGTVIAIPYVTNTAAFLPVLLVMHLLIFIPLLSPSFGASRAINAADLYKGISILALLLRAKAYTNLGSFSAGFGLLGTLHSHPARSSIGYDILWTSFSLALWWYPTDWRPALLSFAANVVASPGVRAPETWGFVEFEDVVVTKKEQKLAAEAAGEHYSDSESDSDHSHSHGEHESD